MIEKEKNYQIEKLDFSEIDTRINADLIQIEIKLMQQFQQIMINQGYQGFQEIMESCIDSQMITDYLQMIDDLYQDDKKITIKSLHQILNQKISKESYGQFSKYFKITLLDAFLNKNFTGNLFPADSLQAFDKQIIKSLLLIGFVPNEINRSYNYFQIIKNTQGDIIIQGTDDKQKFEQIGIYSKADKIKFQNNFINYLRKGIITFHEDLKSI